ncbi:Bacterial transcription activator, effector binding domain protein [Candidatus Magnetomorum sp. HK-1]|nr:Bacterial transcription activator, effector binding domain protein [Candidatus Magnetomorum sp. HK-1]
MNYEIIELLKLNISYFETEITRSHNANAQIISSHWKKFNTLLRVNNVNLGPNWQKFGITLKSNDTYKYQCAYQTDTPIPQFETSIIPSGKFAKFNHVGPINLIRNTINNIYQLAASESLFEVNGRSGILHFEKYDSKFDWNSDKSIVEIYLLLSVT